MKELSVQKKVELEIMNKEKGTIFTKNDFYHLGSDEAVRKAIFRLVQKGIVHRLIDGLYTIPIYSEILQEHSYPSPDQIADKIAEKYVWKISPYGETALNLFGFSTQVSFRYEYISDGPYRKYKYMNRNIYFKHTNNRSISTYSKELSLVIQVITALGKENITKDHIIKLAKYCHEFVKEDIIQDTRYVSAWIYNIFKKIEEINING